MFAEDVVRWRAHPAVEHGGVDGAEVRRELQVAAVEVGERDGLAVHAAVDAAAEQEHRRGRAVIGALAGVLLRAAAELRPGHRQHVFVFAVRREVGVEGRQRVAELAQQRLVLVELRRVGVESAERHVGDAQLRAAGDHLRDELQSARDRRLRVRDGRRVLRDGVRQRRGRRDGVGGRGLEQRGVRHVLRELVVELEQRGLPAARLRLVGRELLEAVFGGVHGRHDRRLRRVQLRCDEAVDVEAVQRVVLLRFEAGQVAAEPAFAGGGARPRALPDEHRLEVREVRAGVADAVDDGELLAVPQRLQCAELRMQAEVVVQRHHLAGGHHQRRPELRIGRVAIRHERVQPVVAAGELDDHQRLRRRLGCGGIGLRRAYGERALEYRRQRCVRRAQRDERHALLHEVASSNHGLTSGPRHGASSTFPMREEGLTSRTVRARPGA